MEEKIKNFKDFGIIVIVLSFIVIPLISYLCIVKILPNFITSDFLTFFYLLIIFVYTFLWIKLFNKLT